MKKIMVHKISTLLLAMVLLGPMALMAQDEDDPGTGVEGGGSVEAPIDRNLLWLAGAGICFAFFYFKNEGKRTEC